MYFIHSMQKIIQYLYFMYITNKEIDNFKLKNIFYAYYAEDYAVFILHI
jgi:hypothetical protein